MTKKAYLYDDLEYEKFEKYEKAQAAIKDILYMYRVFVDYSGLFEDFGTEDGLFDPAIYVDCNTEELDIGESDAQLLHEGSAIKLICGVFQAWGQGGYSSETDIPYTIKVKTILARGQLKHIPELEFVLKEALESYMRVKSTLTIKKFIKNMFWAISKN